MEYDKLWVVWCKELGNPTYPHPSYNQARQEAERLAMRHPGHKFYVLEARGYCRATTVDYVSL